MAPHPSLMTWTPPTGARSKSIFATFQGRKVRIQTPPCRCRIFRDSGSASLYIYSDGHPVQDEFWAYVRSLEGYCASLKDVHHLEASSCIRNETSIRLNVWESTDWFDADGRYVQSPESVQCCSCILEFAGCWISTTQKWGLKWKVTQIMEGSLPTDHDFLDDDDDGQHETSCMFLDD